MNILVTGSNGFLGRNVCDEFVRNGHTVYGVSRSISSRVSEVIQHVCDITDSETMNRIVSEKSIDIIVHLAGKPIVFDCEKNPFDAYRTNGLGTASVLESARVNEVSKVLSIETDKVYGFQDEVPTDESATFNPGSPYEFSKVLAANFAEWYRNYYNINVISVRPANLFGPYDFSTSRLIPSALNNLKVGKGIRVYESALEMKRDFVYVSDAVKSIYNLATKECNFNEYNISNDDPMTIKETADRIVSALGIDIPHVIEKKSGSFKEIPLQEINGSRLSEEFGFEFTPFDQAIQETWERIK
jgi:nucleoside-diphosphate-sugar epimerase